MAKPSVCVAYMCGYDDEDRFLERSRDCMRFPWVTHTAVLDTTGRSHLPARSNMTIHSVNHGKGFEKQPEEGGFHEIRARNSLIQIATLSGCDWILLCDPDEVFLEETYREICEAHKRRKSVIWFECYHYCSPTEYLWWASELRRRHGARRPLHDPHARAIRTDKGYRYQANDNNRFRDGLANRTMHCHIQGHHRREAHIAYGIYHVHTRHMFHPKRPSEERMAQFEKRTSPIALPYPLLVEWERQNS